MSSSGPVLGPRGQFAERFALLYAEAGEPPLKRVTESVARARKVDERGRPVRVPAQRVSDWRRGRNVPARFSALAAVLEVLVGEARKLRATPVVEGLYDLTDWRRLWEQALASPVTSDAEDQPEQQQPSEDVGACPYRGLAVFRQEDAGWFYGRERSTASLVSRLASAVRTGGIVMLVGASGAGKSSLMRAGLGPAVQEGALGPGAWPTVVLTPTVDPLKELVRLVPELAEAVDDGLAEFDEDKFTAQVREAMASYGERVAGPGARPVLMVDQFEETFTLSDDEARRGLFVAALHAACTGEGQALVVLGVRADFYGRCLDYRELAEALQDRQMVLGAMTVAELREAVARPARAVGLQLESGLVDLMLSDLGVNTSRNGQGSYDAGALPLLSHALLATWQRRQAGRMTVAGYRAAGGIQGAVAATAERAWADLDAAGQAAARPVLLRLVRVGEDTQDTRRRSSRQELLEQAVNPAAAAEALEVLARARLITLDAGIVEITHEALLQAWPRLRGWIDRDRAGNLLRQRLEEDAESWEAEHRDSSLLYRGGRLEAAQQWARSADPGALTTVAKAFLDDAIRHRRRATWLRRSGVAAAAVLVTIAVVAATLAFNQRDDALYTGVLAAADNAMTTDPSLAAQLALVAHRMRPDDPAASSRVLSSASAPLATVLDGHTGAVYLTTFSPNGTLLATASYDNTVRLWDVRDRQRPVPIGKPITGFGSWVSSAVFSPDGRTLAAAGDDHLVRLYDIADPAHPRLIGAPLNQDTGTIYLIAFSPDGKTLAAACEHQKAQLWDVHDIEHPTPLAALTGHTNPVRSIAFSPNGRYLAAGGDDRTVLLYDVSNPRVPVQVGVPLGGYKDTVHSVAFSPDGSMLASGSGDGSVRLWDVRDPASAPEIGLPLSGLSPQWSVAFTPDGRILGSAGQDGSVRLWNLANPAQPGLIGQPLTGNDLYALGFSPDGRTLATGGGDTEVRLWTMPSPLGIGQAGSMEPPTPRPDGKVVATGAADGSVRLWDTSDPTQLRQVGSITGLEGVSQVEFTPNGRVLVVTGGNKGIRLYDVSDPAHPRQLGPPIPLETRYSSMLAISPDGRFMATDRDDHSAQLYDIADPAHPKPLGRPVIKHGDRPSDYIYDAVFTPDGKTLITASATNTVRLWDISDPADPKPLGEPLTGHDDAVKVLALSGDGRTLATAGDDDFVLLWDISDPARPRQLGRLTGYAKGIQTVEFSADGKAVITGNPDQGVRMWDVSDPAKPVAMGLSVVQRNLASDAAAYLPGTDYIVYTTNSDSAVRTMDLDVDHAVDRICSATRNVLTQSVWNLHLPQLPYDPPCK
ncbi:AAA family ATPase [Kutzneria kofuensis]|uniref:WD40 repeat protein/energy-coupling factor transporter ATP-binding protein EcfA2 n=1 Tax=Kutzneria kofuensis TaxID=103725 RepID=A0A7W9NGM0_9PSEU|nr:AAA family ATPase [Kutzneria kofuensis]MBB5891218.1 WD40 repeat protein/energy-coupling factor transporter ATP-binding protein EcfA2 [Kutzneria kofuensis]